MLIWRLISSAVIIGSLVAAIALDLYLGRSDTWNQPGLLTVVIVSLLALGGSLELDRLTREDRDSGQPFRILSVLLTVAASFLPVFYLPYPANCPVGRLGWPVVGALAGLVVLFGREMWVYDGTKTSESAIESGAGPATLRLAKGCLAMVYLGFPLAIIVQTRLLGSNAFGMWTLLSIIAIPKLADSGAYFTGHAIGRTKLVPKLSPGKTVEGLIGGLVTGVLGSLLLWFVIGPYLFSMTPGTSLWAAAVYGLVLSMVSVFGDLAESLIKRDCQIKDSSQLVPGLGGVLDVIDSVLATAPAAYAFWMIQGVPGAY